MKIAYHWLREYIALPENVEELGKKLTALGLEVEGIEVYEQIKGSLQGLVIGEVLTCEKHPDADKLSKTTVDIGNGIISPIVCGAPNVAAGQKVVVATVGTTLYPTEGEPFVIKKAKIRGEVSEGMICAEDEIGLGQSHAGIMVLTTDLPNGTPAAEYFKPAQDWTIEIGLTPNRVDAASHWGVARDLKALSGMALCRPSVEAFKVDNQDLPIKVVVENTEACPRYAGLSITGLSVKESPAWLKNRLLAIGVRPINNVVDITNYVLHEFGQPLHAFDADQIADKTVIVKTLPEGTAFTTLDEVERKLSSNDLMICDGTSAPMCIGGVFGGIKSGVSTQTKNIFLESAYFSPAYIRRTSQYHSLKTDASFRFERGIDPNNTVYVLKRAALLIQEVAGGKISSEITDIYPEPIQNFEFGVKYRNIDRLIGKKLGHDFIHSTLENLEIQLSDFSEEGFQVSVPPYRVDVQREADIIEELARVYGYDNLEVSEHLGASYLAEFPAKDARKIQYQITQLLASNGFSEMMNNSLTKPEYTALVPELKPENEVEILNKLSEDLGVMRQTLLFSALEVIAYNLNRRQNDLKFFEFGKVYFRTSDEKGLEKFGERLELSLVMTGNLQSETWRTAKKPLEFHDLAAAVQQILQKMNCTKLEVVPHQHSAFGYAVVYQSKNQTVATLGQVSPKLLAKFEIKQPVFYTLLNWEYLLKQYQSEVTFEEISKFPEVRRDLSLVLDKNVSFQDIQKLALQKEKILLKSMHIFDVYEGENIGKDKKAYALSFILEDKKQTLTDKVIDKTMQKLMQAFEQELGAVIRK